MGRFVNPDNSAFQVALNSKIYIDKTGLIACMNDVLDSTDGYICNSRPLRFGKSYAANMLAAYYSKGADSEEMFSGLEIGKTDDFKKHLNKYDVIHIDVQWFLTNCEEADNVVAYITRTVLDELREIYPEILSEDVRSLPDGLSWVKDKTGQKFIIIIDEWDVLIRDESANKKVQDEYIRFLRSMFKGTEPTKYIQLAYLTGILPIKKERTQSALNNFREYSMLNAGPLASYIGFTEEEVKELCEKYKKDFSEVKRWYDGYQLGKYHVYNPNAVVNLMTDGNFQSYWSGTASYDSIVPLINMDFDGLKTAIIEMLSGAAVEVDVASFQNDIANIVNKDDVLTYLIHMGYLGYSSTSRMAFVQNEEIRQELIRATRRKKWNEMLLLNKADKAESLFRAGYNCSQSVYAAFAEELGITVEEATRKASPFGAGFGKLREVCGAVTGMVMVIGDLYGYDDPKNAAGKKQLYVLVQKLCGSFEASEGSLICRELLGLEKGEDLEEPAVRTEAYYQSRPCVKACRRAAEILEEYMKVQKVR